MFSLNPRSFAIVSKEIIDSFEFDYKVKNKGDVSSRRPDQRPAVFMWRGTVGTSTHKYKGQNAMLSYTLRFHPK